MINPGDKFKIGEQKSKKHMEKIEPIVSGYRKSKDTRYSWPLPETPLNNFEDQENIRKINSYKKQRGRISADEVEIICGNAKI